MFVDFDKIFCKKPQTELKISESLAEKLSPRLSNDLSHSISTFPLLIGCDTISIELLINKISNHSLTTIAYESDETNCISLKYFYKPKNHNFSMNMNISIENATSVKEIIDSITIYNAFIQGKGFLAETLIRKQLETNNITKYNEETLEFWNKVYEIENKLNVTFQPPFTDLDFESICDIEEIYQNIIHQEPIRTNTSINSITTKLEFFKDTIDHDSLGKPIYFEFDSISSFELFGQEINLPCIICIFNAILSKYEQDELKEEYTIFFENESDEKQMYISTLRFLTKEELLQYKQKNQNRILLFKNAKRKYNY